MSEVGELLRGARLAAGLSARALAQRAGTSTTTVTRVERGSMDPTVGMLRRLLEAAGQSVTMTVRPAEGLTELADLTDAWTRTAGGDRPDWTRLRALLDLVALDPARTARVISRRPEASGSAMLDALLAGVAAKLADDAGLPRPAWTSVASRRLPSLWESPGTPRMRAAARAQTPAQMLEHGLVVSADSLWRPVASAGV